MKCVHCGRESTRSERVREGECPSCKRRFALDPADDKLSDKAFQSALDSVSSEGTVGFVKANLHHAVARRLPRPPRTGSFGGLGFLFGGLGGLFLGLSLDSGQGGMVATLAPTGLVLGLVFGLITGSVATTKLPALTLSRSEFDSMYAKWVKLNGAPKRLLRPMGHVPLSPELAEELESYSFDRVVICDRHDTVDLLVGNDFHFENNCAVISADGYPRHAFSTIRRMIRQNPRIEVFVLHDATAEGCRLATSIRNDRAWFGGQAVKVYDVALRPNQARTQTTVLWGESQSVFAGSGITAEEAVWLSKYRMEVAAIRPEQLIKRLFRAMHAMPQGIETSGFSTSGDSGSSGSDTVILWTTDASASDGGGDSFG